ncbi:MAG: radical SAM protein, partial [Rhodospirillales bacterium]|nr:radical SAM protein [Rhodospirillales bacterium]
CRDIDILAPMAAKGLAAVGVSICTLDKRVARALEPRAPRPEKRLAAIAKLAAAGIPVSVMVAPMIPVLTDSQMERVLERAAAAGAVGAAYILLRLPWELKALFEEWLNAHAPDMAEHVLNQVRDSRSGALYVADFGTRMTGTGERAKLLAQRFERACARFGLNQERATRFELVTSLFRPPPRAGDQLTLL